jgi:hypothetical protein
VNVERDEDATPDVNVERDEDGAAGEDGAPRESQPSESQPSGDGSGFVPPGTRRLLVGDPLDGRAMEDRPESWGEASESESQRLARYRAQRPPHHGG